MNHHNLKKSFAIVLVLLTEMICLSGCGSQKEIKYPFYDETGALNNNMFYRNDLTLDSPDPGCIYITEGEDAGYFYVYPTSDQMSTKGFMAWRSKNLNDWEPIGVVFNPVDGSWGKENLWAPEVIYNKTDKKYYMYYSARNRFIDEESYERALMPGLAVSDSPRGPFTQWTGTNADGIQVDISDVFINIQKYATPKETWTTIDFSPYMDENGEMYLFFSASVFENDMPLIGRKGIYGIRMKDMVTPDYTTLTQLTRAGSETVSEYSSCAFEDGTDVNEAPYMLKHNGKYYLTYSMNGYNNPNYSVCQAIGDSPLGVFIKISGDIANPVLGRESYFDHVSGTGHHSIVSANGEMFIVYHAHKSRGLTDDFSTRSIAFDRVSFYYNEKLGYDVMHANGPTYSIQPLPSVFSGYINVADKAHVDAENLVSGRKEFLNDGLVTIRQYDRDKEVVFDGEAKITLTFDTPQEVSSVLVYNSMDIGRAFAGVKRIELFPKALNSVLSEATALPAEKMILSCENIRFSDDYFLEDIFIRAGAAAVAEFEPIEVSKIVIYISDKRQSDSDTQIAVSDIAIMAKTSE